MQSSIDLFDVEFLDFTKRFPLITYTFWVIFYNSHTRHYVLSEFDDINAMGLHIEQFQCFRGHCRGARDIQRSQNHF